MLIPQLWCAEMIFLDFYFLFLTFLCMLCIVTGNKHRQWELVSERFTVLFSKSLLPLAKRVGWCRNLITTLWGRWKMFVWNSWNKCPCMLSSLCPCLLIDGKCSPSSLVIPLTRKCVKHTICNKCSLFIFISCTLFLFLSVFVCPPTPFKFCKGYYIYISYIQLMLWSTVQISMHSRTCVSTLITHLFLHYFSFVTIFIRWLLQWFN